MVLESVPLSSSGLHDLDLTDLSTDGDVGLLTDKAQGIPMERRN